MTVAQRVGLSDTTAVCRRALARLKTGSVQSETRNNVSLTADSRLMQYQIGEHVESAISNRGLEIDAGLKKGAR